ncbi:hypothetical protein GOBAR_DD03976 [Gossypium barbadense]|nr:hypothetical protein GOBAR_DD03976 [Gossypium barbadense]
MDFCDCLLCPENGLVDFLDDNFCPYRSSALLTVQTLLSKLSTLHARAEKLEAASSKIFGGYKSRIHKIEELKQTIRVTKDTKNVAIREYERIKDVKKQLKM